MFGAVGAVTHLQVSRPTLQGRIILFRQIRFVFWGIEEDGIGDGGVFGAVAVEIGAVVPGIVPSPIVGFAVHG